MRRFCLLSLLFSLLVFPLAAAGIAGKWAGSGEITMPDGTKSTFSAYANLQQSGEKITGEAGENESNKGTIEKGSLVKGLLTFQVTLARDEGDRIYSVKAKVMSADRIEGTIETPTPDGKTLSGKLVLTRSKP